MSMDVHSLTEAIVTTYSLEMKNAFPEVLKSVTVEQIPKEDGSFEYTTTPTMGPVEVDEAKFRPLARAIAKAVIEHIASSAEAVDTSTAPGRWRIE
jgi:hypothetical protein